MRALCLLSALVLPISWHLPPSLPVDPEVGDSPPGGAPLRPGGWYGEGEREIARREYFWSPVTGGALSAPNRAHALRSRVLEDRIEVFPRATGSSGEGAPWRLVLATVGFGYEDELRPIGRSRLVPRENRIERHALALSEWYVNDERGIEQGWTIPRPPPGTAGRSLWIELALTGLAARVAEDGLSAELVDGSEALRLRYRDLLAWDAGGRELDARLIPTALGLAVRIEGEGALYPITVDPLLGGPVWTTESDQTDAWFGFCVCAAGDVNADGFADVVVGAYLFDNGELDEGRAFLFLGSAGGLSPAPDWTAEGDQAGARFGRSASGAGDVDGDGFDDVIVGAYLFDGGQPNEGRAFLYLGSTSGLSPAAAWTAESNQINAQFGYCVSAAGDVDGDGFDDLIVGALRFDNGQTDEGRAFLYLGSPSGPSLAPAWTAEGNQAGAEFACSVSGAGDVDGDGFDDVVVGAHQFDAGQTNEGRSFLYLGSPNGPSPAPAWTAESDQANAQLGICVSGAGDVDGDGFDDVVVGAYAFDHGETNEGAAFLYLGSPSGPSPAPDWTVEADQAYALLGISARGAGDVDGDGFGDLIVGAYSFSNGQTDEGGAFLYLGSAGGPSRAPDWTAEGDQVGANFGHSVAGAGDVNGDGFDDVIIGAYAFDGGEWNEGRAYLYAGRAAFDCNGNGIEDADDIESGTSLDCDGDGVPDECEDLADCDGDGTPDGCELGACYCGPAVRNSSGLPAVMDASGSRVVGDNDLTLLGKRLPVNQFGYFLVGSSQGFIANPGGSQGSLCLAGRIGRYAKDVAGTGWAGELALRIDLGRLPSPLDVPVQAGETWNFQAWFRDDNPTRTSNFTDGLSVLFE